MNFKKVGYYLKKGFYYIPRITPGIGLVSLSIRDWKTRRYNPFPYYNLRKKEDWKVIGKYGIQVGWLAFAILKAGVTYKGAQSLINKISNSKDNTEQVDNISKKDKRLERRGELEKSINYEELTK
jgi:hypothetical protein